MSRFRGKGNGGDRLAVDQAKGGLRACSAAGAFQSLRVTGWSTSMLWNIVDLQESNGFRKLMRGRREEGSLDAPHKDAPMADD